MDDPTTIYLVCGAVVAIVLLLWLLLIEPKSSKRSKKGQEVAHSDAEHLAILLVSEIKTYNRERVLKAFREKNILSALDTEINRSRVMYRQRTGMPGAKERDYFLDALVNILAHGDEKALGKNLDRELYPNGYRGLSEEGPQSLQS